MKGRSRYEILSWALYDFANSPFTTLVITFVYSTYFAGVLAVDESAGRSKEEAAAIWMWTSPISATRTTAGPGGPVGRLHDHGKVVALHRVVHQAKAGSVAAGL